MDSLLEKLIQDVNEMRLYRLLAIVMLLLNEKKISASKMADYFEVSARTIYRDIDTICQAGIPIVSYQGVDGGFSIMENYKLDKNIFTPEEIISIIAALEGLNSTLEDRKIKDITEKIKVLIPAHNKNNIESNEDLIIDLNPWANNQNIKDKISLIRQAIKAKNIIQFTYINLKHEQLNRRVEPMSLILKGTSWYLYGFCLLREDFRIFKLSRMKNLITHNDDFKLRSKSFKVFNSENNWSSSANMVHLVLKFNPSSLLHVQDYFGKENMNVQKDGGIIIETDFPEDEWIISFILSFGDNVEVIKPKRYRTIIKKKASYIAKHYN